jgi:hypothetical protein
MHKPGNDIFTRRKNEAQAKNKSDEAQFTWFGPVDAQDRFRFLVVREDGDDISILPGEGRFKKGLRAWRWDAAEGGEHETYVVQKTKHNRIDLRRVKV